MYGSYDTIEDTPTLIFERRLSHPVDRVWEAITDPDVLIHWFPCAVDVDLRPGGAMEFTFAQDVLPDGSNSMPGEITFAINGKLLAQGVTATEAEVGAAVAFAFRELKLVVEPGGAVGLAALLAGHIDAKGKTVVIVLSGGNVDSDLYARLIA